MAGSCVVDTSAWIEWLMGDAVGRKLTRHFPDKPRCIVPTIAADAIVYATARQQQAELLTCDAHFNGLPDVVLFRRAA
jgi:predicted nucleic acid-binding protein